MTLNGTGSDDRSGISSYIYMYKKSTESTWKQAATVTSDANTNSYTLKNLTGNTQYDIKLVVRDKAGNEGTAVREKVKTSVQVKVGDYVAYTPTSGSYTVTKAYSGHTADQTLKTETLNWRVWSIDENTRKISSCSCGADFCEVNIRRRKWI